MKKAISVAIKAAISLVLMFIVFWFSLPALNPKSSDFWSFVILCAIIVLVVNFGHAILNFFGELKDTKHQNVLKDGLREFKSLSKPVIAIVIGIGVSIVMTFVFNIIGSQFFNSASYRDLITITDSDFSADVAEINMTQIPVVDYDTAEALGKRKLGEMSDLVSQFEIADDYTQINYKNRPTRVTPMLYGDPIKWFNNQSDGIPGYIMVDMTTQEVTLVRLEKGIKYSRSEYFMRNLNRYLRFKYPTAIFDDITFEIDDNGTPYWVASVVDYKIGFWSGKDIGGAVLLNAVTGECDYYDIDKVPTWVDQVYDASLVIDQLTYNGKYRSGFWNSVFGQKGVLQPTDGYNYLAIDDDVWLYTGMTSVVSDESNVGFVLVNLRTKETRYYAVPGAEEYSAMSSAEEQVQHLGYTATFPILLNIGDRPTYFMSLKGDAGLVKMYAFVDVQQYQVVGTGSTVKEARKNYIAKLSAEGESLNDVNNKTKQFTSTIEDISSAVVDGNTVYYIILDDNQIYTAQIGISDILPFLVVGDNVGVTANGEKITEIGYFIDDEEMGPGAIVPDQTESDTETENPTDENSATDKNGDGESASSTAE
ncbi:MAG: CvpA family protein [Clostridia bacterium]|nr:CvpA family protein [Clostridia bacterium]